MKNANLYTKYKCQTNDITFKLPECQKHILKMLDNFLRFCNDYNISVFLLWGTLLGAKRNGKIIPWDDDIDLGISPEDFNRLLSLKDKISDYGLDLIHYSINSHIHSNEIRIYQRDLYEICDATLHKYLKHVYIDVFSYCKVTMNDNTNELISKIRKCSKKLIIKETKWKSTSLFRAILRELYKTMLFFVSSTKLHIKIDKYITMLDNGLGDYKITFPDTFHNNKINFFDKDAFDNFSIIDFENIKCLIPSDADYILTKAYGNWETPNDRSGGKIFDKIYIKRTNNTNS